MLLWFSRLCFLSPAKLEDTLMRSTNDFTLIITSQFLLTNHNFHQFIGNAITTGSDRQCSRLL